LSAAVRPADSVIRVFGLAGDEVVREGLLSGVDRQPDMSVVGQAVDTREGLPAIARTRPHVALIDTSLGHERGIDACPVIRRACPSVACLLMASMTDERTLVEGAVAGAATIVPKQLRGNSTVDAIRAIVAGAGLFDFTATRRALDRLGTAYSPDGSAPLQQLLEQIGEGRNRAEIAGALGLARSEADALIDGLFEFIGLQPGDYPG
jgi:DNA-binding NarL/FixJ family response regulator